LRVNEWAVRRLIDKQFAGDVQRAGTLRLIPESLVPAIERELRGKGYAPGKNLRAPRRRKTATLTSKA
jgi:hypothetical protein